MKTYIKLAVSSMKSKPFFTFITLFGISLTIAFLLVIGSFVDTAYGHYEEEKNMGNVLIGTHIEVTREHGYSSSTFSYEAYKDHFKKMKTAEEVVISTPGFMKSQLYYKQFAQKVDAKGISSNFFDVFDFDLLQGQFFTEQDQQQGRLLAVITDELAQSIFGTENPIGKKVRLSSKDYEVYGVVKQGNSLRENTYADIYTTYQIEPASDMNRFLGPYKLFFYFKNEESLENGRKELDAIVKSFPLNKDWREVSMEGVFYKSTEAPLHYLFDIKSSSAFYGLIFTIMVLFMALPAFNLVNINITRIMERSGEIGVRKAFGASTSNLILQLMTENTMITLIGGLIGFVLASLSLYVINYYQILLEVNETLELNPILFLYGLILTLIFSLFSGAYPAFKMARFQIITSLNASKQ